MKSRKKVVVVFFSFVAVCVVCGGFLYKSFFINLYGFPIRISNLRNVVIYANQHAYYVSNPALVQKISLEAAHLKRTQKDNRVKNPGYNVYFPIPHFLIQTKNNASFGGDIWKQGTLMDANGYYWQMTPQLLQLLKNATKDPKTEKVY